VLYAAVKRENSKNTSDVYDRMKLTTVPGEKNQGHNELNAVFVLLKTITQFFFKQKKNNT
jgi:hypothetical protein